MYKYTDRLGVRFDPTHRRYIPRVKAGQERSDKVPSLNGQTQTRKVAWEAKRFDRGRKRILVAYRCGPSFLPDG